MNAGEDERLSDDPDFGDEETAPEDEFEDEGEEVSAELEADFEDDGESDDEDIDAVVQLSVKEQNARTLEIRRAIEERMEKRQLSDDIDYLDMDLDD